MCHTCCYGHVAYAVSRPCGMRGVMRYATECCSCKCVSVSGSRTREREWRIDSCAWVAHGLVSVSGARTREREWRYYISAELYISWTIYPLNYISAELYISWTIYQLNYISAELYISWTIYQLNYISGELYISWTIYPMNGSEWEKGVGLWCNLRLWLYYKLEHNEAKQHNLESSLTLFLRPWSNR